MSTLKAKAIVLRSCSLDYAVLNEMGIYFWVDLFKIALKEIKAAILNGIVSFKIH